MPDDALKTIKALVDEAEFADDTDDSRDPRYLVWIDLSSLRAVLSGVEK